MPLRRWSSAKSFKSTNLSPSAYQTSTPLAASVRPTVSKRVLQFTSLENQWQSTQADTKPIHARTTSFSRLSAISRSYIWLVLSRIKSEDAITLHITYRVTLTTLPLLPSNAILGQRPYVILSASACDLLFQLNQIYPSFSVRRPTSEQCRIPNTRKDIRMILEVWVKNFRVCINVWGLLFNVLKHPRSSVNLGFNPIS